MEYISTERQFFKEENNRVVIKGIIDLNNTKITDLN